MKLLYYKIGKVRVLALLLFVFFCSISTFGQSEPHNNDKFYEKLIRLKP